MAGNSNRAIRSSSVNQKIGALGRSSFASIAPKTIFIVACEGKKTEYNYIRRLFTKDDNVAVKFVSSRRGRSPDQLVEDIMNHLGDYSADYSSKDRESVTFEFDFSEAWVVFDRDEWTSEQIQKVYDWSQLDAKFDFAMSNPMFEYWLTLHVDPGKSDYAKKKGSCVAHLKSKIENYSKGKALPAAIFKSVNIKDAIRRAKSHDSSKGDKWPCHEGCTTVYRLVENILRAK